MKRAVIAHIPVSHLDLFWLGSYKTCLERGAEVIRQYLDRCLSTAEETFFLETVVFAQAFLQRYPQYRDSLINLVHQGRVEVGAAYIDRWEHMVLGEAHIRNIQLGLRWYREVFGQDNHLVTHPDLPSFIPQVAQLYAQAGIKYYVTSRKVFEHGAVWRLRAPDGSSLIMLNYPGHYGYLPLDVSDVPAHLRTPWLYTLDVEASLAHFPLKTIAVSGGAGDLGNRETFRQVYGRYLEEFVAANRERYPDLSFTYAIPSEVLAPYDDVPDLPELAGEAPSVWGIGIGEDGGFTMRSRAIEGTLLTAETLAALADHLKMVWRPPTSPSWQGIFFDGAFFGCMDPIPPGQEFRELWRMHLFTMDHNAGGQEGVMSSFHKKAMQDRCLQYAREIIDCALDQLADQSASSGDCLVVFNPHGSAWSGPLAVTLPEEQWAGGMHIQDEAGRTLPAQYDDGHDGQATVQVTVPALPSLGYRIFALGRGSVQAIAASSVHIGHEDTVICMRNAHIEVAVDRQTGSLVRIIDRHRAHDWGSAAVGRIYARREIGNDATMRIDTVSPPTEETFVSIDAVETGPLFTRLRIHKRILRAEVEQTVTLWADQPRLDLRTRIFWWGDHNWQLRQCLPSVVSAANITYGSPFHGTGWLEVMPEAAPRNPDEILPEDYPQYREVQGWLHLDDGHAGLTLCTLHPAFRHDPNGLEAVLLRTAQSCGDARLYWEHAGERSFNFVILLGEADWWMAQAQHHGARHLKPPVARLTRSSEEGPLPIGQSFLQVHGASAALSSVYRHTASGHTVARIYDADGHGGAVRLTGPLAEAGAASVNFLEEQPQPLSGGPGDWQVELSPWRIQTVLFTP